LVAALHIHNVVTAPLFRHHGERREKTTRIALNHAFGR
jgi:hypothetical protein